jgi:ABC-type multidrug transport system ATPase subunit
MILLYFSGLDSCTSRQCLAVLKLLAREGRTVVCTIHQPSASLFEMFDHLYVIAEGMCIYQGSIKGMVPYLSEVGLDCPPYHNPADFGTN